MPKPNSARFVPLDLACFGLGKDALADMAILNTSAGAADEGSESSSEASYPGCNATKVRETSSGGGGAADTPAKRRRVAVEDGSARKGAGTAPQAVAEAAPVLAPPLAKRRKLCSNCFKKGHISKFCKEPKRDRQKNATSMTPLPISQRVRAAFAAGSPSAPSASGAVPALRRSDDDQPSASDGESDAASILSAEDDVAGAVAVQEDANEDEAVKFSGFTWTSFLPQPMRADGAAHGAADIDEMAGAPACKVKRKSKPKNIPRHCKTAGDFFSLLFDDEMMALVVTNTNSAARENPRLVRAARFKNWRPVDAAEMMVFFGICTYLGVVKVTSRKNAWGHGTFGQAWVRNRMSLRRFENIVNALNCAKPWLLSDAELTAKNKAHSFWQLDEMVAGCNRNCKKYWRMGWLTSLDEGVIPFKGRHRAKCYNKAKPAKNHIKKFCFNCAKTGFNYRHYFYEGKDETRSVGPDGPTCATAWPVLKLLSGCPELFNHNRLLAYDNWFTSAHTIKICRDRGFHCVGTVKTQRLFVETQKNPMGFPHAGIFKPTDHRQRGDILCHEGVSLQATCPAYVTTWQDAEPVYVASSYAPQSGSCIRKVLEEGDQRQRVWTLQTLPRPNVIAHYNSCMGGTDLHDMRLSFIRSTVKSRRWEVRVLTDMFASMLMNAFVLRQTLKTDAFKLPKVYTCFDFISEFLEEVCPVLAPADTSVIPDIAPVMVHPQKLHRDGKIKTCKPSFWAKKAGMQWRLDGVGHVNHDSTKCFDPQTGKVNATTGNKIRAELRRKCICCGTRTVYFCYKCKAALCLGKCFYMFHNENKLR